MVKTTVPKTRGFFSEKWRMKGYHLLQVLGSIMEGIHVGYNLITFSIAGFLGIPGVLALYGVQFYMLL